ncbi:hypothetical protein BDD43_2336 [Mucilaginibacter gracilis]|uniref:Uncharacterized protein n=1 Tax=Mucilaginibacter gracilis TaxID=423350 RepID=A0A495IZM0_9SPHI|nr:hypothetical protein [Mucilaginibacter gracilis]RKR82166.1 hypothetical protein BDD43_2336 [Mucilaginibacter gracilis]
MRNIIFFLSLAFLLAGIKPAAAQIGRNNNSDWKVPPPISPIPLKTPQIAASAFIKMDPQVLTILPPIPPVEPLSVPHKLVESEQSSREMTEDKKAEVTPKTPTNPCCCCCCCPQMIVRGLPARVITKRRILPKPPVVKHRLKKHLLPKQKISGHAVLKPKVVKHRLTKRVVVRYIYVRRDCACTPDTGSLVRNKPSSGGGKSQK